MMPTATTHAANAPTARAHAGTTGAHRQLRGRNAAWAVTSDCSPDVAWTSRRNTPVSRRVCEPSPQRKWCWTVRLSRWTSAANSVSSACRDIWRPWTVRQPPARKL
jgi:hypothetical protein